MPLISSPGLDFPKKASFVGAVLASVVLLLTCGDLTAQTLVSVGQSATASAYTGGQVPSLVTDGLFGQDQHWSAGAYAPQWITVDLGQTFSISSVTVIGPLTAGFTGYTVEFNVNGSLDNSSWTFLGAATLTDSSDMGLRSEDFILSGDPYRYIRLDYTGGTHHSSAAEIQVYAIPEPSTYAALAGLTALGLAAWRRRAVGRDV